MMAVKEFVTKQIFKQLLPMAGNMSDKNFGRFLSLARRLAPATFFTLLLTAM